MNDYNLGLVKSCEMATGSMAARGQVGFGSYMGAIVGTGQGVSSHVGSSFGHGNPTLNGQFGMKASLGSHCVALASNPTSKGDFGLISPPVVKDSIN